MGWLHSLSLKWGLAVIYLGICLSVLLLFPPFFFPVLVSMYLVYLGWTYWTWESSYSRSVHLRPLTRWDIPDFERFQHDLTHACEEAGLRREPVWAVLEDDTPNAAALSGTRGIVFFTTGALKLFSRDELLAIAGHEIQHIASRDGLPALIGGAWLCLIGGIAHSIRDTGRSLGRAGGLISLASLVLMIFALILDLALLVASWIGQVVLAKRSRHDEHLADLAGARITSAATMINALERFRTYEVESRVLPREYPAWSPAWIAAKLHASHPNTDVREPDITPIQGVATGWFYDREQGFDHPIFHHGVGVQVRWLTSPLPPHLAVMRPATLKTELLSH